MSYPNQGGYPNQQQQGYGQPQAYGQQQQYPYTQPQPMYQAQAFPQQQQQQTGYPMQPQQRGGYPPQQQYHQQPQQPSTYAQPQPSIYNQQFGQPQQQQQQQQQQGYRAPALGQPEMASAAMSPSSGQAPSPVQLQESRPRSPSIWYSLQGNQSGQSAGLYSLPCMDLQADIEFHVATAFVTLHMTFVNSAPHDVSALLAVPLRGTVTSASVLIGQNRLLETAVIAKTDAQSLVQEKPSQRNTTVIPKMEPTDTFVPDMFRLPIPDIARGAELKVSMSYMEPLKFVSGEYHFYLPLDFAPGSLPRASLANMIRIKCSINSITPNLRYRSDSHNLQLLQQQQLHFQVQAQHKSDKSADFHLAYCMPSEQILGGLITQPAKPYSKDPRGCFALFVTPPTRPLGNFGRNFVFVIDRSGSMHGDPFEQAVKALGVALDTLNPGLDTFNIIAFDDKQEYFNTQGQVPFNQQTKGAAMEWIKVHGPRGLTDIGTPLTWSLNLLDQQPAQTPSGAPVLSFVVLLTDGCVNDEREIAQKITQRKGPTRILTFGIGKYCNWYFLKMLAQASRGFNTNVMYTDKIYDEMVHLMEMANLPVLTDVGLQMQLESCEIYPYPLPDLFVGAPLTIAGMFKGNFPQSINLVGKLANGQPFSQTIYASSSNLIPVDRVFLKQRIDNLTAKQWLDDSKELAQEIEQIGVENSFPTPFTTMVAYETTPEKKAQEEKKEDPKKPKSSAGKKAAIAALAVGGAFAVGAAIYTFGDVGATMAGVSGLAGSIGDIGVGVWSGLGDAAGAIGGFAVDAAGAIADVAGDGAEVVGDLAGGCCDFCGDAVSSISCGFCGDCQWLSDGCNACFGACGDIGGGVFDWIGGCLGGGFCDFLTGGACELCGSCIGVVGDLLGNCGDVCGICGDLLGNCSGVGDCICEVYQAVRSII